MGDIHSCLRNASNSSLDMAEDVQDLIGQGRGFKLEGRGKFKKVLADGGEDETHLGQSGRQRSEVLRTISREISKDDRGKRPLQPNIAPRRRPRGIADDKIPKPRLLSHTARRERLEELKKLNQQLKNSPPASTVSARAEPERGPVTYPAVEDRGPSLLELEVQALASLGFVKLQPDLGVEVGSSKPEKPSEVELLDLRRAGLATATNTEPQKENEWEDLLELQNVARKSLIAMNQATSASKDLGGGGDLLELQKVALASMKSALHPGAASHVLQSLTQSQRTASQVLKSPPPSQGICESDLLEIQKTLPTVKCTIHKLTNSPDPPPPSLPPKSTNRKIEPQSTTQPSTKCILHPDFATPDSLPLKKEKEEMTKSNLFALEKGTLPPPSEEAHKDDLPEFQKQAQPKCKLHPLLLPFKAYSSEENRGTAMPLPPSPEEVQKAYVLELQKQSPPKCKVHPVLTPLKPSSSEEIRGTSKPLPHSLEEVSTPLQPFLLEDSKSTESRDFIQVPQMAPSNPTFNTAPGPQKVPSPTPSLEVENSDLLELQRVALANMKAANKKKGEGDLNAETPWTMNKEVPSPAAGYPITSSSQSVLASGPLPPTSVDFTSEDNPAKSDVLDLESLTSTNMKDNRFAPPVRAVLPPPRAPKSAPEHGDLLELQKVALANMKASNKPFQSDVATENLELPPHRVEGSDLLQHQRQAWANLEAANKHHGQEDPKAETSRTTKEEVPSCGVVSPASSSSSFHLEPASGPLETILVELTSKDKALQDANRKVAEKDHLLHEYEGELSKALQMLESMSARCTDAKEETARALSEAKGIYDELNQAWSAVEDFEIRSNGSAVSPREVDNAYSKSCGKGNAEDKEQKWVADLLKELQKLESSRTEGQREFELQKQRNKDISVELQQLDLPLCTDHFSIAHEEECLHVYEDAHEDGDHLKYSRDERNYVHGNDNSVNESDLQSPSLEGTITGKRLVAELRKIEATRKEDQNLFQVLVDRNHQILAQLMEMRTYQQQDNELLQKTQRSSEQHQQWEAEKTQLNACMLKLHEALDMRTKEANALHEQTLQLNRAILEQEQQLRTALEDRKLESSNGRKKVMDDFSVTTGELEDYICLHCSNEPAMADFVGDTRDLEIYLCSSCLLADYICSTCSTKTLRTDLILPSSLVLTAKDTADFEGDTSELERYTRKMYLKDKAIQVKRKDAEKRKLTQEKEDWEEEKRELIERIDDFEASLLKKEENIVRLIEKMEREESAWHEEKYHLVKRCEETETSLLAKEEEVIELSAELEMAKSTLQGFKYAESSTVISTSSDNTLPAEMKNAKSEAHAMQRLGRNDARELLDLRCEVVSLHECLVIKAEAITSMEKELARSYGILTDLRTKLALAQESEWSQHNQQPDSSDMHTKNLQVTESKVKGKVAKKPRLLDQAPTRSRCNSDLVEKLRLQSQKLAALEKENASLSKKIADLSTKCKYLEEIRKLYRESQDPLKAEAIMELENELERNVQIIQKMQLRCSDFQSRAIEAESRLVKMQSGEKSIIAVDDRNEKMACQAERENLLGELQYFREEIGKKDEELHELRQELKSKKPRQIEAPPCKSNFVLVSPEQRLIVDEEVDVPQEVDLSRHPRLSAPIEHLQNADQHSVDTEDGTNQSKQIRDLTQHLREQWKLQCVMEDRLNAMMAYVSERVKELEQQRYVATPASFTAFHEEAKLMKVQLEQQLQVLRGTLSSSFHKLDEAKQQLQEQAIVENESPDFVSPENDRAGDDAHENNGKTNQLLIEKVALEDSAHTLQEKTFKLLHRLTSTRLQWNMNMLAASVAAT